MRGIGARSVTAVVLCVSTAIALWRVGHLRADYWEQLSPWVPFAAGGFAVLAGTLAFKFWRLAERSEYYFRIGYRLPFAGETTLLGGLGRRAGRALLVGHAPQVEVIDVPPVVQRSIYIAVFSCVALIALTNRAVALLRDVPAKLERRSADYCAEPAPPPELRKQDLAGCKLVLRAYKLGYTKDLGTCAPQQDREGRQLTEVCRRRQLDEPYLHYAWRLFDRRTDELFADKGGPGTLDRLGVELDHFGTMFHAMFDSVAMRPRSSHHLFTNLPDPRPTLRDRVHSAVAHDTCGVRIAHLPHFPRMEPGSAGPSKLLEHVVAQLLFNPSYQPVVADCKEVTVHWGAPPDACAKLAANPQSFLDQYGAADPVHDVLSSRTRKLELATIGVRRKAGEVPSAQQVVSFQCLIVGDAAETASPIERTVTIEGEPFHVREARTRVLASDEGSQIRLYKRLADLFAEGFGYGRLTSNQAIGAAPEEATMAASFREPTLFLTKLDLLRDADLFLGNDWLAKRPDLLDVYPYHLHLQNFVEIFRRQYLQHRGRL